MAISTLGGLLGTAPKVELPVSQDEPLESKAEKCELRIEGMTCSACVEVGDLLRFAQIDADAARSP